MRLGGRSYIAILVLCLGLLAAATGAQGPVENGQISGAARVIDGDTLQVGDVRVRLFGIDAPERGQSCGSDGVVYRCGELASEALARRIGARPVSCAPRDRDRYGRVVAVCQVGGEDLGSWLVRAGWAVAYTRYARDYVADEADARRAGRGLWAGDFVQPSDWRRGNR